MAGKLRRALTAHEQTPHITQQALDSAIVTHAATPHGGNAAWADITGKPSTFPPEAHSHDYAATSHGHTKADVGLGSVDNTADAAKPVSAATQTALDGKEPANANIQAHVAAAHAPSNAQKNSDITKAEIEAVLTGAIASHSHAGGSLTLAQVYPVGCIYTSTVSTNPATVFGMGTWVAFGAGRCLVGLDSGQTEFDTVEETGGAKTHTLQTSEMPAHTHVITSQTATSGAATSYEHGTLDTSSAEAEATEVTGSTGGGGAHNNLQPYIVVYFFKRTA